MQIFFEQEGRLEVTPLTQVLKALCDNSENGMLTLEQDGINKSIFLNNGNPVFATSNRKTDRLGVFLFQNGKLTLDDFEQSSKLMTQNRRHGEILVEMGIITRQDLNWAVKEQVKEIIMSMFHWNRGTYLFISMDPLKNESIILKTKTLDLILEGTRRISDWSMIQHEIGLLDSSFQFCADKESIIEGLYLKPKEKTILQKLQNATTVREICSELEINDFEICRTLMGFQAVGIIERVNNAVEVLQT